MIFGWRQIRVEPVIVLTRKCQQVPRCMPLSISLFCSSRDDNDNVIYKANHWANYAVLILQGRALVETSTEHLLFEAGPFMLFGETVLKCECSEFIITLRHTF